MKREKHVYQNSSKICHAWANWNTAHYCHSSNVIVDHDIIYSYGYHFPMAKRFANGTFLLTTRTWSVTTAKHMRELYHAIPPQGYTKNIIFCDDVKIEEAFKPKKIHDQNIKKMKALIEVLYNRHMKARTLSYRSDISRECKNMEKYCRYFKRKYKNPITEEMQLEIDKKAIVIDEYNSKAEERAEKRKEQKIKKWQERIPDWRAGKIHTRFYILYDLPCILRLNSSGEQIETSWGASVNAKNFMTAYQYMMRHGFSSIVGTGIDGFSITEVTEKQAVVGCHKIAMEEIHAMAKLIENEKEKQKEKSAELHS